MSGAQAPVRLHPATARRMASKMPPREHHSVTLSRLGSPSETNGRIAVFDEPDFLGALWADLRSEDWLEKLEAREPSSADRLRLPLPIHRRTVVVLYEASCAVPGRPRLGPEKIESMGLVMRRVQSGTAVPLGWKKTGGAPTGWQNLEGIETLDPDPERRRTLFPGHNAQVLEQIAGLHNDSALPKEDTIALQSAPGDICADLSRTILFAVLPLFSSESSPALDDAFDYDALSTQDASRLDALYDWPWREGVSEILDKAGEELHPDWVAAGEAQDESLKAIVKLVRQAVIECGMADDTVAAAELRSAFASISLPLRQNGRGVVIETMPADEWILTASPVLLGSANNTSDLVMPLWWPARTGDHEDELMSAMRGCLTSQAAKFQPDTPKFDNPEWRYRLRPFVRVRHAPDCPIRLVWGEPSQRIGIRPWWDNDAPPHKISLPALDNVKDLKPNIAFEMPPELAAMMARDPEDLMEGKGGKPGKFGIGWLCSFSLPVITICAFIVLNIFLQLFNIFFQWMLWLKVCIPIPTKEDG